MVLDSGQNVVIGASGASKGAQKQKVLKKYQRFVDMDEFLVFGKSGSVIPVGETRFLFPGQESSIKNGDTSEAAMIENCWLT